MEMGPLPAEDHAADDAFSGELVAPHIVELVERAQLDTQIATAKKYPRDPVLARKRMLSIATMDRETAESCFYTLWRWDPAEQKKKAIKGPSVRLAEIAFSQWGNIRGGARVIDNDGKVITSQGVAHDLETNALFTIAVQRRITGKDGKTFSDDMQVTTGNAANAIAFRNAVFKIVPGSVVKSVYDQCRAVAVGDAKTFGGIRDAYFLRLEKLGVSRERVLAAIEKRSIELVDQADLETIIGLATSVKDGNQTYEEAFPPVGSTEAQGRVLIVKFVEMGKYEDARKAGVRFGIAKEEIESMIVEHQRRSAEHHHADDKATVNTGGEATTAPEESSAQQEQPAAEETGKESASPSPEPETVVIVTDAEHQKQLAGYLSKLGLEAFRRILKSMGFESEIHAAAEDVSEEAWARLTMELSDALLAAGGAKKPTQSGKQYKL